jgi:large subunit ribosomal protein L14
MIQSGTYLNVVDNSGAKKACCLKVLKGFQRRYAIPGDTIVVSIKSLRSKRRSTSRAKKGQIFKALVVRTKVRIKKSFSGESLNFFENSIVLLNNQNKLIGTRIFGTLPKFFRYTKFLKLTFLASGLVD